MVDYYDRAGEPISRDRWVELSGDDLYRTVAVDQVGTVTISTVWLGLDHSVGIWSAREIFESMVFGGERDQDCCRYSSEAAALAGHAQIVASVGGLIAPAPATHYAQRVTRNPESAVIDAIDELVNEQLAIGPVDDYSADRYVKCGRCGQDWHGLILDGCLPSDLEGPVLDSKLAYVDQIGGIVISDSRGYTIADLQQLRAGRYAYREQHHYAPACPHHTLDYAQGEIPTCHDCGEQLSAGELVLTPRAIAERLAPASIRFWRSGSAGELEEIVSDPRVSGAEPAWLGELVECTLRYVRERLAAITGIDVSALNEWLEGLGEVLVEGPARIEESPTGWRLPDGPLDVDAEAWFGNLPQCSQCWRSGAQRAGCNCLEIYQTEGPF